MLKIVELASKGEHMIARMISVTSFLFLNFNIAFADVAESRMIHTNGSATVYVVPDEAVLRFEIHSFDADLKKARALNDAACAEVLKLAQTMGAAEHAVQTLKLRSEAVYEQERDRPRNLVGYTTARTYALTLRDLSKFQELSDALLARTDCTMHGLEYRSKEHRKHRDEARRLAIRAAREKAQLLAGELGAKVGLPRTITEGGPLNWSNWSNRQTGESGAADVDSGANQHAPLGQIELTASVSVSFDLTVEDKQ